MLVAVRPIKTLVLTPAEGEMLELSVEVAHLEGEELLVPPAAPPTQTPSMAKQPSVMFQPPVPVEVALRVKAKAEEVAQPETVKALVEA